LNDFVVDHLSEATLLVVDEHNVLLTQNHCRYVLVDAPTIPKVKQALSKRPFSSVIAVGGCSALDVGRACAAEAAVDMVALPTILSTSCISVNRSVLYENSSHTSRRTVAPREVNVSIPALMAGPAETVAKWSHSGFGDLFSGIAAALDHSWRAGLGAGKADLGNQVAPVVKGLNWVLERFSGYDEECLGVLARLLHEASLDVIRRDATDLNAAGEHDLYYQMLATHRYSRANPTHGELVAVGTLLVAFGHGRVVGDFAIFQELREAFAMLGLPTTQRDLESVLVEKGHLFAGLSSIQGRNTYLAHLFRCFGQRLVDDCFR
jgi:glycerol dehydrogenase-like iron-containing ADH family enzyme